MRISNHEIGISLFSLGGLALFVGIPVAVTMGELDWTVYAVTVAQPPNYYVNFFWAFFILFFTGIRWNESRNFVRLGAVAIGSTIIIVALYIALNSAAIIQDFSAA